MSWQAQTWAIEVGKRFELEPGHRWMLMTLANYADPEGNDIYPSIGTLMADTGFGENTIRRHIKHLILCGLVDLGDQSAATRIGRADRRPKVYRLCMAVDNSAYGVPKRGATVAVLHSTGFQASTERGSKRGATVAPNPLNPKENLCRECDRERPASALSASGICADCLGIGPNAAAEGAAYREQLRLRRLAHAVGSMP